MEICPYYNKEKKSLEDEQMRPTLSQNPKVPFTFIWCSHRNSPAGIDDKFDLKCEGDKEKCIIDSDLL